MRFRAASAELPRGSRVISQFCNHHARTILLGTFYNTFAMDLLLGSTLSIAIAASRRLFNVTVGDLLRQGTSLIAYTEYVVGVPQDDI